MDKPTMTPLEMQAALRDLAKPFGAIAHATLGIASYTYGAGKPGQCSGSISYSVAHDHKYLTVHADSFDEVLAALHVAATTTLRAMNADLIRKMALAVISATADAGSCNEAALRLAGFTPDQIALHGADACREANEMASNGPFSIASGEPVRSNGQPAEAV